MRQTALYGRSGAERHALKTPGDGNDEIMRRLTRAIQGVACMDVDFPKTAAFKFRAAESEVRQGRRLPRAAG